GIAPHHETGQSEHEQYCGQYHPIFQRNSTHHCPYFSVPCCPRPDRVLEDLRSSRPTWAATTSAASSTKAASSIASMYGPNINAPTSWARRGVPLILPS